MHVARLGMWRMMRHNSVIIVCISRRHDDAGDICIECHEQSTRYIREKYNMI